MGKSVLSRGLLWRQVRRLAVAAIIASILAGVVLHRYSNQRGHYLAADDPLNLAAASTASNLSSLTDDWKASCHAHGFSAFKSPRKVFDLVLLSTELDWLEIRLHTHAPYVDYFVVIESPTTFTNRPKPLYLGENWDRFKDFHHKIIYRVVEDPIVSENHWDHEEYLRNALLHEVFPSLAGGPQAAYMNDVLIVSDMDELIKPGALLLLRHCEFPKRLTLRSHFYYYSFQWHHRGEQWAHPQASTFGASLEDTIAPNDLRLNPLGSGVLPFAFLSRWWNTATLWNAGWHCSSCFSTIDEMQTKMNSFSHQVWNTQDNREASTVVYRVRNGLDLFARPGQIYDRIEDNQDVPPYILNAFAREGRFRYLLNRNDEDAGFEDWPTFSTHDL